MRSRASDSRLWIDPKRSKGDLATAVRICPGLSPTCRLEYWDRLRQRRPVRPPEEAGFTMNTMSATTVHPERPMFRHECPVFLDLPRRAIRIPSEHLRHPRGDLRRGFVCLIRCFVKEAESPDEDVRQREGHFLMHRDVDLRPHVVPSLHDRVASCRGVDMSRDLFGRESDLEIECGRFVETQGEEFLERSDGRAEGALRRQVSRSLAETDFYHVDDRFGHRPMGRELAPRDGDEPIRVQEHLGLTGA